MARMQFWFARQTEIPIREQLVTQIILAILSDDLKAGERLPSTRELARRFRLHPNTISAGYRQLQKDRWVEFRRGSGVYVRSTKPQLAPAQALDQLIANLNREARQLEVPLPTLRARLRQWLDLQPPDHFLLIEPNEELRKILQSEIEEAIQFPLKSCSPDDCAKHLEGAIPIALPNRETTIRQQLPANADLITLQVRSIPTSLGKWLPAPTDKLVAVASSWPDFLKLARTFLQAAGFDADTLIFRDARDPNWQRGLKQTAAVVCDTLTAKSLPKDVRAILFALLSEAALTQLRDTSNALSS